MRFSVSEDIDAPRERVFAVLGDVSALERMAAEQGAEVTRESDRDAPGPGMTWHVRFEYGGKMRDATVELTDYAPPRRIACTAVMDGLEAALSLDLEAVAEARTRVEMEIALSAKTLAARLLLQPLKVGRKSMEARLQAQVSAYARTIEARLAREG